ncbi:FAD-binding oxidoreductase [Pelomonas sp. CA6]|uniref:FAD-binding oxidoreductase n=1 Tax=Pelomonas sp. CA6 TaxID=2907999 RepID=UPI001F4C45F1|nr:FAD-binding oxidoreductase [Pelomonas sp. CA6]MCH7345938.1 FAD-binding oxidoreductase [Pelomonas sp. CA6]
MAVQEFLTQARALCGEAHVAGAAEIEPRYLQPARYGAGQAAAWARPGDAAQAAALLALARRHGLRVVPQGAHTGLVRAATPQDARRDLVLSTERLREVFELDELDRTLRVSAGWRLSEINERLAPLGLWFPIDLSADPSVGGMLSHNTGGTRMLRYGDVRANTLGLVVLPAETLGHDGPLRLGQGLQKDNSALALQQLFIGASGSLGLIVEATLKLSPLPRQRAVALLAPRDTAAVLPLYQAAMARWGSLVSAFEGLSREALAAGLHGQDLSRWFRGRLPEYALLIELGSELPRQQLDLAQLLQVGLEEDLACGLLSDAVLEADEAVWALRHRISEGLRAQGTVIGLDLSLPRRHFMALRERGRAWLAAHWPQARLADFGHLGDGGLHFNVLWPREAGPLAPGQDLALRQAVYAMVAELGGSISAEHGVGPQLAQAYRAHWQGLNPALLAWSGRLQSLFDPERQMGLAEWGLEAMTD